ncbi:MAG: FecR domain-containing protein [Deltaproteobacteria bacterium]|nr:FecR domain-containing protein [Deltaproteobacteria bacterium]
MGDIIRTKSKSRAEVTFLDSSILRLAQSSRVEIKEYFKGVSRTSGVFKLFRGKIQSIIKLSLGKTFGLNKSNRFEVHTPTAVIGVRGTNFFTYYNRGISGSTFKEGTGYGYSINRPDQVMNINAGQSLVTTSPDIPPEIRSATDQEMKAHEIETSPQGEDNRASGGGTEKWINNSLKKELDEKKPSNKQFLKRGIDGLTSDMEKFNKGIDIPQQVPQTDPYHTE